MKTASSGVGIGTVVLIVLITLKLTGQIAWSWFWVLTPVWLPAAFAIILLAIMGAVLIHTMANRRN